MGKINISNFSEPDRSFDNKEITAAVSGLGQAVMEDKFLSKKTSVGKAFVSIAKEILALNDDGNGECKNE